MIVAARRATISRRHRIGILAVGVLAVLGLVAAVQPVEAAWSDPEIATASATAGTVSAPVGTTCTRQSSGGTDNQLTFSWTLPQGGLARTGYTAYLTVAGRTDVIAQSSNYTVNQTSLNVTAGTGLVANTSYELHFTATSGTWSSREIVGRFSTQNTASGAAVRFNATCSW